MYKVLLKCGVCSLFIFLLKTDCAVAKPFRYVGVGAGVNVHGNHGHWYAHWRFKRSRHVESPVTN